MREGAFGSIAELPQDRYPLPRILPPARHPRLMIAQGELPALREKLEQPVYAAAARQFAVLRQTPLDDISPDAARSGMALAAIEARAYAYLLFGDRREGLEAVSAIRRYFDVVSFEGLADDYRFMGQTMFTAAEVYDWCHELLTEEDRYAIVASVENRIAPRMEIGMPPCLHGVVAGHQAEAQLLRDWLAFSIAVYDEYPDVYNFVAGRFFYLYVPARNFWYRSESPINGSSYGGYRFTWDLWSAWLFRKMSGEMVYVPEMQALPAQWLHFRRPDGQGLRDGDDYAEFGGRWDQYGFPWFYAGNLFRDPVYRRQAFLKLGNRDRFFYTELTLTPVQLMIFDDDTIGEADYTDTYPLVKHYSDPFGVTMARTGYDVSPGSADVMALMKIGGLWTANHHHMDFGHFQLYYKGILASDSGAYIHYGSPHDMSYNKQTIAHNCILIFKPGETNGRAVNSGGQLMVPGEVMDLSSWLSDPRFRMARVLGHDENPAFTYLGGDITGAYGAKAGRVIRRMAFIPTGDPGVPALMLVFDRVSAADASYRKTSLLHCQEEPEIAGSRVTIRRTARPKCLFGPETQYNGMLVAQMLLPPNPRLSKIGGPGQEFVIEGKNYPYDVTGQLKDCVETGWGRVEVSPAEPAETDWFLNVMYVCDNDRPRSAPAELLDCGDFYGAQILSHAVFFPKTEAVYGGEMTLRVSNPEGLPLHWHLTGLKGGVWSAVCGDSEICRTYVAAESGVLNLCCGCAELCFRYSRS